MSEEEKKRRQDYKANRKKWILLQVDFIAAALLITIILGVAYGVLNKTYYINYSESSAVDYRVSLKENDFYDTDALGDGQAYVAALADKIYADFSYDLRMDAKEVDFRYTYRIDARLEIIDGATSSPIFSPTYNLVPDTVVSQTGNSMHISSLVSVSYDEYNNIAKSFIDTYGLQNTENRLVLEMYVHVVGASEAFEDNTQNTYTVSLNVPLTQKTISMSTSSSVPVGESRVLACERGAAKTVFLVLTIVSAVITAALGGLLVVFIYMTRSTDINYEIKIKKLLAAYKSYIQRIGNPFDATGYQLLYISEFSEMLEIRDTIQSPVLMYENEDKTRSTFLIPTNTRILYIFEIKIEDYDEIYEQQPEQDEEQVEEIIPEEPQIEEILAVIPEPEIEPEVEIEAEPEIISEPEPFGVEVIDVVWQENADKVYRYDPDGENVDKGDTVLVPSRDREQNKDIVREATVSKGNYRVNPEELSHPLKKIIGVVRRRVSEALSPRTED